MTKRPIRTHTHVSTDTTDLPQAREPSMDTDDVLFLRCTKCETDTPHRRRKGAPRAAYKLRCARCGHLR